jgi:hypothetical protein
MNAPGTEAPVAGQGKKEAYKAKILSTFIGRISRWWGSRGGIRTRQPVVVDDWILLLVPLPVCV